MPSIVLTDAQKALVDIDDGCHLVVAPPGSGKTEVLAQRIVRLLRDDDNDFNVLALSFTRSAAASMRARVAGHMGDESKRLNCTTYHSFCLDILRHYGQLVGIRRELTVYEGSDDRIQVLAQGLTDEGFISHATDLSRTFAIEVLDQISRQKRLLVPADASPTSAIAGATFSLRDAHQAYDRALSDNAALDFDGVLQQTHSLLTVEPRVARHYRLIYRFILIDEGQDTSLAQYEILRTICGAEHRNVFMVADPAQSIYGFAGSSSIFVDRFVEEFGAVRHELTVTFRCGEAIVDLAKRLFIQSSKARANPALISQSVARGAVSYETFSSEEAEAIAAVDWAESLIADGLPVEALAPGEDPRVKSEHIAVLARSRLHLRSTLAELDRRGIEYHFSAGEAGIFDSDQYRILLYSLRLLINPRDVASARTLLSCVGPFSNTGTIPTYEELHVDGIFREISMRVNDGSLRHVLDIVAASSEGVLEPSDAMDRIANWEPFAGENDAALAELMRADSEIFANAWTAYRSAVDRKNRQWQGLFMELVSRPRPEAPGYRVLTIHAAKGLEFRAVTVVGLNEGSFPDFRSAHGDALESEQRLAYVAASRAARVLRLSRPLFRSTRYGPKAQIESRFIAMAGLSS